MRAALAFVASRLFARVPNAPADVAMDVDDASGRVVVTWTPGPSAGRHNLEEEEHVVSARFRDGACEEALRGSGRRRGSSSVPPNRAASLRGAFPTGATPS